MTMVKQIIFSPPILTQEQIERLNHLEQMPDSEINYQDIPIMDEWANAIQGRIAKTKKIENSLLDEDVTNWLVQQDTETKSHISDVIRHIMAMKQPQFA